MGAWKLLVFKYSSLFEKQKEKIIYYEQFVIPISARRMMKKNVHYPTCEILYWKKIITLNMEQELRTKMLTIIIYLLEKNWKPPPLESFVHLSHVFLCPLLFCFELDKAGDGKWCFLFYSKMFWVKHITPQNIPSTNSLVSFKTWSQFCFYLQL